MSLGVVTVVSSKNILVKYMCIQETAIKRVTNYSDVDYQEV